LSHYINGVAKRHGEISRHMFSRYVIDAITNGVHASLYDKLENAVIPLYYNNRDQFAEVMRHCIAAHSSIRTGCSNSTSRKRTLFDQNFRTV
jgi:glucan phosphorylase